MIPAKKWLPAAALCLLWSCTAPGAEVQPPPEGVAVPATWAFEAARADIAATSCGANTSADQGFVALDLTVTALSAKQAENLAGRLPQGTELAGAWELSSSDPNFGGLSGLAVDSESSLLAVSDAGGWFRLALEAGTPVSASAGYMRGANGRFLNGKDEADAEGLALLGGTAFVSFERDFRIEAFALGTCGAAATAVPVAALPDTYDGLAMQENEGPEALSLSPGGTLQFGYESLSGGVSPLGEVYEDGSANWSGASAANPPGFALVAMDSVGLPEGDRLDIFLYRAFDPLRGARSVLTWGPEETDRLTLSRPVLTDNFEGLAAQVIAPGKLRLWIVSDDNFQASQRTLLYAFDIAL